MHSEPFEKPIDPEENPESYKKIKEHIDLKTMKEKLENFKYLTKEDFVVDLNLLYENAKIYFSKKSKAFKYAKELKEFSDPLIEKLVKPNQTEIDELKAIARELKNN